MALDVHLVTHGWRMYETGSYTGFGFEGEHEDIMRVVFANPSAYPQLEKMQDYYNDAHYIGSEAEDLRAELDKVIPQLSSGSAADTALRRYREIVSRAVAQNKTILLFSD